MMLCSCVTVTMQCHPRLCDVIQDLVNKTAVVDHTTVHIQLMLANCLAGPKATIAHSCDLFHTITAHSWSLTL